MKYAHSLFFVSLIFALSGSAIADQFVIQPGSSDGSDTCYGTVYVASGCGDIADLFYGGFGDKYFDFIRFDVWSGPDASKVSKVTLLLHTTVTAPNDPKISVKLVAAPWSETNLSRSNRPDFVSAGVPLVPQVDGTFSANVTQFYKRWKTNSFPNYGLVLIPSDTNQTNGKFASSDHADPSVRPELVIDFAP